MILFIDEIHRFNKAQQDYLLPFVEDGTREQQSWAGGTGNKYAHDYPNHYVRQQYLPYELDGKEFYKPTGSGYEAKIRQTEIGSQKSCSTRY